MEKLVSVIMPVCDEIAYLHEAVDSIMQQTYKNIELIVIDSSEDTKQVKAILSRFNGNMKYYFQEKCGVASALNYAISQASGEYIARMDADDISLPRRIELQIKYLEKHTNVSLLGTRYSVIDECGRIKGKDKGKLNVAKIKAMLMFDNPLIHPSVMFRRKIFDIGWHYNNVHAEDLDLWSRLAKSVHIEVLNKKLLLYRSHQSSSVFRTANEVFLASTQSTKQYLEAVFDIDIEKYKKFDFIKNFYIDKLNDVIEEEGETYVLRQFLLLCDIYSHSLKFACKDEIERELTNRWNMMVFHLHTFSDSVKDLRGKVKNFKYRKHGFFLHELSKRYKCGEHDYDFIYSKLEKELIENLNIRKRLFLIKNNFMLYGMGEIGIKTLRICERLFKDGKLAWSLLGVVDKEKIKIDYLNNPFITMPISEILGWSFDYIVISSTKYYREIQRLLITKGIPQEKILPDIFLTFV